MSLDRTSQSAATMPGSQAADEKMKFVSSSGGAATLTHTNVDASAAGKKWVYHFGGGSADGSLKMKQILGGKGAGLAEMASIGLPVPAGFTISAEGCGAYARDGRLPADMTGQIEAGIGFIERTMQASFGGADPSKPILLLSVRSGDTGGGSLVLAAAVSMPGMMDTVLNLGMNDEVAAAMIAKTGNPRFVWDCYRRFIDMFSEVVVGVKHSIFEAELTKAKAAAGVKLDTELNADQLRDLTMKYKEAFTRETGKPFPHSRSEQLHESVLGVFRSWNTPRAITYRKINRITGLLGTAVNVQAMVFGNTDTNSGSGVLFTRNPATGEDKLYGEVLMNAQGEDVVSGIRTPMPIIKLHETLPAVYDELYASVKRLERHTRDMQDVEFTIQDGHLWILQCRDGKRTGAAALKIARDMLHEGLVTPEIVVGKPMVTAGHVDQLLHPRFSDETAYKARVVAKGMPASPGAAVGRVVFSAEDAEAWKARGERVILVRTETSAEDVAGMHSAEGILTSHGGMTSHAAVVARGWGKPCVTGCGDISIDYATEQLTTKSGKTVRKGDWLSLHGGTGEVIEGAQETVLPDVSDDMMEFITIAKKFAPIHVHANADNGTDTLQALKFGADGIGLVRTEHMFWGPARILSMREAIIAHSVEARTAALDALFVHQKQDFVDIFTAVGMASKAAGGKEMPVTIRLLDPPLHEYLPFELAAQKEVATAMKMPLETLQALVRSSVEANPMMGCRGVRVSITKPEIPRMQARAIIAAACEVTRAGLPVWPEIMVPLVGTAAELEFLAPIIREVAEGVIKTEGVPVAYKIGTMMEVPRACLTAGSIAKTAQFFSFGTNDLTAMTFGYSRDDAPKFIPRYIEAGVLPDDPFQTLDKEGVGEMIRIAVERGRATNPSLPIGVCGEVGGDERSVPFFVEAGITYVSCSPYRVPVAIVAAAQTALKAK